MLQAGRKRWAAACREWFRRPGARFRLWRVSRGRARGRPRALSRRRMPGQCRRIARPGVPAGVALGFRIGCADPIRARGAAPRAPRNIWTKKKRGCWFGAARRGGPEPGPGRVRAVGGRRLRDRRVGKRVCAFGVGSEGWARTGKRARGGASGAGGRRSVRPRSGDRLRRPRGCLPVAGRSVRDPGPAASWGLGLRRWRMGSAVPVPAPVPAVPAPVWCEPHDQGVRQADDASAPHGPVWSADPSSAPMRWPRRAARAVDRPGPRP